MGRVNLTKTMYWDMRRVSLVIVILLSMIVMKNGTKFVLKSSSKSFLITNTNAQQVQQNNRSVVVYNTPQITTVSLPRCNSTLHYTTPCLTSPLYVQYKKYIHTRYSKSHK